MSIREGEFLSHRDEAREGAENEAAVAAEAEEEAIAITQSEL